MGSVQYEYEQNQQMIEQLQNEIKDATPEQQTQLKLKLQQLTKKQEQLHGTQSSITSSTLQSVHNDFEQKQFQIEQLEEEIKNASPEKQKQLKQKLQHLQL